MKIMFLCAKDMAGTMYSLCTAVNKYTKHEAEQMITNHSRYRYPAMYHITNENRKEMHQKIYDSDAIVFHEWMGIPTVMKLGKNKIKNKILALTYGGGGFRVKQKMRNGRNYYRKISKNVKYIACSADFLADEKLPWVPRCTRTEELRETYNYTKLNPPLIVTSPSKGSDFVNPSEGFISKGFSRILKTVRQKGFKFQATCISSHKKTVPNATCLKLKAPASIFFDRLYPIYGVNSLEAGAFGSAVITGTAPHALSVIKRYLGGSCPYIIVNSWGQAQMAIEKLLNNPKVMKKRGQACYNYSKKIEEYAAKKLVAVLGG